MNIKLNRIEPGIAQQCQYETDLNPGIGLENNLHPC